MKRSALSRPVQSAASDGLLSAGSEFLDYGCGLGDDVELLLPLGIRAIGWDPVHRPLTPLSESSIVNLGYVVNVIEDPAERVNTLRQAWALTGRLLIVSGRLVNELKNEPARQFSDGFITKTKTFQKYYEQSELRQWIELVVGEQAVVAAPGIFYVFRDLDWKESFLASRIRRKPTIEKVSSLVSRFTDHRDLLQPLVEFLAQRGRLPDHHEARNFEQIGRTFGSLKKAFRLILRVTGAEQWDVARTDRRNDLLVYLALSRFGGRPRRRQLPLDLDSDVRAFCGTYRKACETADHLLFQAGNRNAIDESIRVSQVGKKTHSALYVHRRALSSLPSLLRVYEGCARTLVGEVEGANVVKLHREAPQVSYLGYPGFDVNPHPALVGSLLVNLQTLRVSYRDYSTSDNPPILHRKEEFIMKDDPNHDVFAMLTAEEEKLGLYADTQSIGTAQGWRDTLSRLALEIVDHSIFKKPNLPSDEM